MTDYPRRIVCLTHETCETLYLLGDPMHALIHRHLHAGAVLT